MNFSAWELIAARLLYWVVVPLFQHISAMVLADTFQYFTRRAFHVHKWLYSKFIRTQYSMAYCPNTFSQNLSTQRIMRYMYLLRMGLFTIIRSRPFPICLSIAGLDNRQAAFFGAVWTVKTVVDHRGYDFPYNPRNIGFLLTLRRFLFF